MLSDLLRWGRRRPDAPGDAPAPKGDELVVPSKAFPRFLAAIAQQQVEAPVLLDLGPVIGGNVGYFGERLGCKLFIEDVFADVDRHARANTLDQLPATIDSRFRHGDATVDGILCWDVFDFLDKPSTAALARQVVRMLKPGGTVMGFFTTATVERAPFTKYEIVDDTSLRHRHHQGTGGRKTAANNRDIIRMFEPLIVSDSFLLKNNTREILLRRTR